MVMSSEPGSDGLSYPGKHHAGSRRRSATSSASDASRQDADPSPIDVWLERARDALQTANLAQDDPIRECGGAIMAIINTQPDVVLELASEKLSTWPFAKVPECWRRAYEDACLARTLPLLQELGELQRLKDARKRPRLQTDTEHDITHRNDDLAGRIVHRLDMAITISGAPVRKGLILMLFDIMQTIVDQSVDVQSPHEFVVQRPTPLQTRCVAQTSTRPSLSTFEHHMRHSRSPLVLLSVIDDWPALQKWSKPAYLLRLTVGGRRLVPVEIGKNYMDVDWSQEIMSFGEYLEKYIFHPVGQLGYIAQHDLLSQMPALLGDITTPDYCWTQYHTLSDEQYEHTEVPLMNAWLGPAGTRTPIHHDRYHNVFCQVVGYKYVRLFPPEEGPKLYPEGMTELGVDMSNTSRVDFAYATRTAHYNEYPLFRMAQYQEVILGPGDCLYIPVGWWHFVESLTISFSVSFWWK